MSQMAAPRRRALGRGKEDTGLAVESRSPRYLFPQHPNEVNRLDLQHYAIREALGANYFAPIWRPRRVLDVGAGGGRWCLDMVAEFPQAFVVGVDLAGSRPASETGYGFAHCDVTGGLPFAQESFDFVHQRFLRAGIPVAAWPEVVAELVRVTRPEGWIELVEWVSRPTSEGPATSWLFGYMFRLAAARGLDPDDRVVFGLEQLLGDARLEHVRTRRVELPVGEWGGRAGSFLASDLRAMFTRLAPAFEERFSIPQRRTLEQIRTSISECEELHSSAIFLCAWGQRSR